MMAEPCCSLEAPGTHRRPSGHPGPLRPEGSGRIYCRSGWEASSGHPPTEEEIPHVRSRLLLSEGLFSGPNTTWITRYRWGSRAILQNSAASSLNLGRLSASIIQPGEEKMQEFRQLNTRELQNNVGLWHSVWLWAISLNLLCGLFVLCHDYVLS